MKLIRRVKLLLHESKEKQNKILTHTREMEWAHIYHDSIRGREYLETLSLNVGRWAGNYTFFYLLNRILHDFEPKKILELGLGESTKFVEIVLKHKLKNSQHLVIEHDKNWKKDFLKKNEIHANTQINLCELVEIEYDKKLVKCYKDFEQNLSQKFDLYIIDGPLGSQHYSRFDMVYIGECLNVGDEFIFIIDDYHRKGEQETVSVLKKTLYEKGLDFSFSVYHGNKSVAILTSKKYKFACNF